MGRIVTTHPKQVLDYDHVPFIGGGIGINGLVAWILRVHQGEALARMGRGPLAGAVVKHLRPVLDDVAEKEIWISERFDARDCVALGGDFGGVQAGRCGCLQVG